MKHLSVILFLLLASIFTVMGQSLGCSCVRADYPKDVIRPGKRGVVKICYNPAYRPGFFSKEIVILSNNNAHYNRIWVKGTVKPCAHPVSENYPYEYGEGLWMNFEVMAFGTLQEGESKTMKLKFANDTDKDFDLMFVVIGGNKDVHFTSPHLVKAHGEGVMPITYQNSGKYVERTRVYPVVNGKVLPKPLVVTRIR